MEMSSQFQVPAAFGWKRTLLYSLDGRLSGSQSRSRHCGIEESLLILPGIEFRSSTQQPSSYLLLDITFNQMYSEDVGHYDFLAPGSEWSAIN
jgi:hypothetical protein